MPDLALIGYRARLAWWRVRHWLPWWVGHVWWHVYWRAECQQPDCTLWERQWRLAWGWHHLQHRWWFRWTGWHTD